MHTSSTLTATMEEADFLLGAFAFGRDALTGVLFQPKPGQLEGYKNPILETVRLLQSDKEYAATRCHYRDVFLHPTLVCKESFTIPEPLLLEWWPQLGFPKTVFKLVCRITLVDLSDRMSYYDVPEISDIDPQAEILLRPYKPLIEAFRKHGAEWIASEPVLRRVETAARVYQVLSIARSSGLALSGPLLSLNTPTHYKRVDKRAEFRDPAPDSGEPNPVPEALRSALLAEIPKTKDALVRASQSTLSVSCAPSLSRTMRASRTSSRQSSTTTAVRILTTWSQVACRTASYLYYGLSRQCSSTVTTADGFWTRRGRSIRSGGYPFIQSLVQSFKNSPPWFESFDPTRLMPHQAKEAVPLCMEMLIIHLSYAMLTWFEQQQNFDSILAVYETLAHMYRRGAQKNDVQVERWPTVERALDALGQQMNSWANKDILVAQEELTSEDPAKSGEEPLKVQKKLMDLYALKGEINKAMVCALVAVRMQEERFSPINDRSRILQKAAMIARTARAQKDVTAARTIIESVESVLRNRNGRRWREGEIGIKKAMLASLNDATLLLHSQDRELEKSATLLLCRARKAFAEVHQGDSAIAAKWMIAAQTSEQAADSMNDNQGLNRYAKTWLLDSTKDTTPDTTRTVGESALNKALLLLLLREILTD